MVWTLSSPMRPVSFSPLSLDLLGGGLHLSGGDQRGGLDLGIANVGGVEGVGTLVGAPWVFGPSVGEAVRADVALRSV